MKKNQLNWLLGAVFAGLLVQGCAASESATESYGGKQMYDESYSTMRELVKRAVRGAGLTVIEISEPPGKSRMRILISKSGQLGTQAVRQHRGAVTVEGINGKKTRVTVENPDYHYTVPSYKKENYQRIIFSQIESRLNE